MNKEELIALEKVIEYMWLDEMKDYEETYDIKLNGLDNVNENEDHIFVYLYTLDNYLTKSIGKIK